MKLRMALVGLVCTAIGAGVAVGVMLWEPWSDQGGSNVLTPEASRDAPRLTEQEAIGLVASRCAAAVASLISRDATASYTGHGKWAVRLTRGATRTDIWTVDEAAVTVIPLGENLTDLLQCRPTSGDGQ